jgi:hypothetical protein
MDWISKIKGKKNTNRIKRETNTLFRQLDTLDVYFTLTNNAWKKGADSKDALVFFSRILKYLVVIPKKVVDKYIFYPIFEEVDGRYQFKTEYLKYNYKENAISILLSEDNDVVSIRSNRGSHKKSINLFRLPKEQYWKKIDLSFSEEPLMDLVYYINEMTKELSDGKGVIEIQKL